MIKTLEEAAENYSWGCSKVREPRFIALDGFIAGTKWQAEQLYKDDVIQTLEKGIALLLKNQEKMYSEKEVLQLLLRLKQTESYDNLYDWFEEYKKK
jgi:hypothetical protein